jgi:hypothetical protein
MIQDEVCLPPQEEDECLSPDVLLHIAYDVVSQLDNAADFWQLSLEELSLQDFLVEQIDSLQPVVEAQVDHATHLSQDTIESVHAPWPSQPNAASFGRLYGAPACVDGQVVIDCCGPFSYTREVMLSPPRQGPKPPWDAPPLPHQLVITPPGRYYGSLHPNSQPEVCSKAGGVVVGCNLFFTGDPQVATGNFLCVAHHMKLPEVTLLKLSLFRAARGRL